VYQRVGKVMPDDEILGAISEMNGERDMVDIILV